MPRLSVCLGDLSPWDHDVQPTARPRLPELSPRQVPRRPKIVSDPQLMFSQRLWMQPLELTHCEFKSGDLHSLSKPRGQKKIKPTQRPPKVPSTLCPARNFGALQRTSKQPISARDAVQQQIALSSRLKGRRQALRNSFKALLELCRKDNSQPKAHRQISLAPYY